MRTTLTLEPDVARALERLRKEKRLSFKQAVNDALRRGLERQKKSGGSSAKRFRTRAVNHGKSLTGNFDDVAGVLALVEDEVFK